MIEGKGKAPTIVDVAQAAGVTDGTVSRALRGDARVRPETRDRVLAAAVKLGYRPNQSARGLKAGKQTAIGVFCDGGSWMISNSYFGRLLAGLAEGAERHSRRLVIYLPEIESTDTNPEHDIIRMRGVDAMAEGRVDAAIVLGGRLTDEDSLERLKAMGMPTVVLGSDRKIADLPQITSGMTQRARLAGEALLDAGRKRLGFMGLFRGSLLNDESARILGGLARARVGGQFTLSEMDHFDITDPENIKPMLDNLLAAGCDGLVISNEDQCAVALDLLQTRGIRVPEDLSIVSFGRPLGLRARTPAVVYVEANLENEGRRAVDLLADVEAGRATLGREFEWALVLPRGKNTLKI